MLINYLTDDLSANKTAQQYKTYNDNKCQKCVATNAVDRDINTCTRGEDIGATSKNKIIWWFVDLGVKHSVYNIRIQFKEYGEMYSEYLNKHFFLIRT